MKAIFSSFGRRVNIGPRDDISEPSNKATVASSTRRVPQAQASFSSLDNAGKGIGDVPVVNNTFSVPASANGTWKTKINGSLRGTISRRKPLEKRTNDEYESSQASSSETSTAHIRPSHPPSSFRDPSRTSRASDAVRGLNRKLSSTSRRGSTTSDGASADHSTSYGSTLGFRQSKSSLQSRSEVPVNELNLTSSSDRHNISQPRSTPQDRVEPETPPTADLSTMSSSDLAARLNELAVANADGLLTDDEYRTLRQAVFDRMMQADRESMVAPTTASLSGLGLPSHVRGKNGATTDSGAVGNGVASNELLSVNGGRSRSSLGQSGRQASSIRSSRSGHASSFQGILDSSRKSSGDPKDMQRQDSHDSHSSHNVTSETRGLPVRRDSTGKSSQLSSGDGRSRYALSSRTQLSSAARSSRLSTFGRLRAASHTQRLQADAAARNLEESFSAERTARSLRTVSLFDPEAADLSGGHDRPRDTSPTSTRAGIAPASMFGAEYADKSSAEIKAEISVVEAEGNRMLSTFLAREETLLSKHSQLEPHVVSAVLERVQESNPLGNTSRLGDTDRESIASRHRPHAPPSSCRTRGQIGVTHDPAVDETADLRTELTNLYTQKAAVVKRYQDRLAYLQSKLRSAAIREGLK